MAEYPKRESHFAHKFVRLLVRTCAANEIGIDAAWLLTVIAHTEDAAHYRKAVTFWNDQLMSICGWTWGKLNRARKRAMEAGWLHYESGGKGKVGRYWVTIPPSAADLPDHPVSEDDPIILSALAEDNGKPEAVIPSTREEDSGLSSSPVEKQTWDKRGTNVIQTWDKRDTSKKERKKERTKERKRERTRNPIPIPIRSIDRATMNWSEVQEDANQHGKTLAGLDVHLKTNKANRRLVLQACALIHSNVLPVEWLEEAIESLAECADVLKPAAYLTKCLGNGASDRGVDFTAVRRRIKVPANVLERKESK